MMFEDRTWSRCDRRAVVAGGLVYRQVSKRGWDSFLGTEAEVPTTDR